MVAQNLMANNGRGDHIANQVGKCSHTLMLFAYFYVIYVCFMSLAMRFLQVFTGNNKFGIQSFIVQRFALLFVIQERGDRLKSKPIDVVS
jgi:hypothetical protein